MSIRKCKVCNIELNETTSYGDTNLLCKKHKNEYRKKYRVIPSSRVIVRAYQQSDRGKTAVNNASERARLKYPEKWNARAKLRYAVKKGEIVKSPCEVCSDVDIITTKVQAHHYLGYEGDNWSKVRWLCSRHHAEEHRNQRL